MGLPVPYWLSDRDYYARNDVRREAHVSHIETQQRINQRIDASAGDGSYSVLVTKKDVL